MSKERLLEILTVMVQLYYETGTVTMEGLLALGTNITENEFFYVTQTIYPVLEGVCNSKSVGRH